MAALTQINWQDWCQPRGIELVVLFGSRASGKTHAGSDTDIAIFSRQYGLRKRQVQLYGEIEDLLGLEADLAIIDNETDPTLYHEVFRRGKCLYEAIPGLFVRQKVHSVFVYEDAEPLRRYRDRLIAKRIARLRHVPSGG